MSIDRRRVTRSDIGIAYAVLAAGSLIFVIGFFLFNWGAPL